MNKPKLVLTLLITVSALFITGFSDEVESQMDADLHNMAANSLKRMFQDASPSAIFDDAGDLVVDGQRIDVLPKIEHLLNQRGNWLIGVRFDLRLDGKDSPRFVFGSVGIGASKEEARKVAVEEWLAYFGKSFVPATLKSDQGIKYERFIVYPGLLGIRAQSSEKVVAALGDMDQNIMSALVLTISKQEHAAFPMTLNIMITMKADGQIEGECRKNGEVSDPMLALLAPLPWPKIGSPYLLKKYYIIRLE